MALPVLYGEAFRPAVLPACVLLPDRRGRRRGELRLLVGCEPSERYSFAMGAGAVVTVALDVLLIPRHAARGAAAPSSASYMVTAMMLMGLTYRLSSGGAAGTCRLRRRTC